MSAPNQSTVAQTEVVEATVEPTPNPDATPSQTVSRIVVSTPSVNATTQLTTSQTPTTPTSTGRQVLPVVYLNLPRNRLAASGSPAVTVVNQNSQPGGIVLNNVAQVLPPGARGGSFLPGLAQKITVNATLNSAGSSPTAGSPASQQPHFVTIRSTGQSGNTNTSVTSQPHFVTIPKESLPEGILKPGSTQSTQQFVTMVPKSSFAGSVGSGQIVTIRAPILTGSGGVSSGNNQNQIVTIQAPGIHNTNQTTMVPISTTTSSGKTQISYISPIMKNGTLPNIVSSTPKMVLSTVPTLQKSTLTFSSASQTMTSSTGTQSSTFVPVSNIPVTNIVTLSRPAGSPTITIVPTKEQTPNPTVTVVASKDASSQPTVSLLPAKEATSQTVTIVSTKEPVAGKPTITILPQKEPTVTMLSSKEPASQGVTVLSSKDTQRLKGLNPMSLIASKDSTVTLVSSKDIPPGSPITVLSSKDFALLSSNESSGNSVKLVSTKDSHGTNTYTILSTKETTTNPAAAVVSSKDPAASNPTYTILSAKEPPANPSVTVLASKDSSAASPTYTIVPSKESTADNSVETSQNPGRVSKETAIPSVTLLPSKDSSETTPTFTLLASNDPSSATPTFTILSPKDAAGNSMVSLLPSKDSAPNSTFTILSSKEGGHPTLVPTKEVSEAGGNTQETAPVKSRLTTLPFYLSPEMTVTTSAVSAIAHPQFQQIGKDTSSSLTTPAQGFIPLDPLVECQSSLGGVSLPESTTLTPILEAELTAQKTEPVMAKESVTVHKEPVEIEIHTNSETKHARRTSLLISNNAILSKTIETSEGGSGISDQLTKCLKEAISVSKESAQSESLIQTAVIDDDEVTLIKVNPSSEETMNQFTALDDNPDDIKIELIKCNETLESSKDSDMDGDDVSINIESKPKSRSPSPSHVPPSFSVSTANLSKVTKLLPTPKSLSNIRSPSILKNHIANKGNFLSSGTRKLAPKPASLLKPAIKVEVKKEVKTELKREVKKEVKKEADSAGTPDDFDPIKALEWKNGVGLLPGSDLKFRVNEFGFIEIISDDDKEQDKAKPSQQSSQNSDGSLGSGDEKDVKPNKRKLDAYYEDDDDADDKVYGPEDIVRCKHCGVYGLAADFVNQRYCNTYCQEGAALKKAAEFKREQENRALKLRRKRRRLERISERSERVSVDVKKEENVEDRVEDRVEAMEEEVWSSNPTPIGSDDDNMSVTSNDPPEPSKGKGSKSKPAAQFVWAKYLESRRAKAAPAKLFKDEGTYTKNKFKVGMKLEGIDPEHPSHFCVLTVAEVKGCRLRLHFDEYSDSHDFWVNIDSPEIFPVGWTQKNNRRLDPPRGFPNSNFNWTTYLKACRAFAAPRPLFVKGSDNAVCPNGFRTGMKLEAVDRKESSLICVATVANVLDNRILVHFDSWDDMYDYWVDPSSPYIHPVGWCAENGLTLTPPNEFKDPSTFSWSAYLKQTKSISAPARAFKQRPPVAFKPGMRLEAVDKRVPQFIRVATIEEAMEHRLLIHFDGWPHAYDFWVDEDSPDIHRPGWCRDTKHPLEAPLTKDDLKDTSHCVTPGCRGEGHIKGAKFSTHTTLQNCPYALENLDKEGVIPDRLNLKGDLEFSEIPTSGKGTTLNNTIRLVEGRRPLGRPPKWRRYLARDTRTKKRRASEEDDPDKRSLSPLETATKLQLELHQSVFEPGYRVDVGSTRSACWAKHSLPLHSSPMLTDETDPQTWNSNDVAKFVSTVAGLEAPAQKFCDEEIDGEALLLMTQQDLVDNLGLKLGPAIKLYNCIVLLRQKAA